MTDMPHIPAKFVVPFNINGLNGRMLAIPAKKNKRGQILVVYDLLASLERMYHLSQTLSNYGSVTLPDLPGFGGMDSFYKIGRKPSLDNLSDYLAAFIKLKYKKQKITLIGFGYGSALLTRTLQRYPSIAKRVELLISVNGIASFEDLNISSFKRRYSKVIFNVLSAKVPALLFRGFSHNPTLIKIYYSNFQIIKKLKPADKTALINIKTSLWALNDPRTLAICEKTLLKLNNLKTQVKLPLIQVVFGKDLDLYRLEQHQRIIYSDFKLIKVKTRKGILVLGSLEESKVLITTDLKKILNKKHQ